jgi:uncharacterized protein (DUF488 family)
VLGIFLELAKGNTEATFVVKKRTTAKEHRKVFADFFVPKETRSQIQSVGLKTKIN